MGRGARADTRTPVALGFSVHTGWAVALAAAGPADRPRPLLRRRLELSASAELRFAYHAAARLQGLPAARRHVEAARADAGERARAGLQGLLAGLAALAPAGHALVGAGIVLGNRAPPEALEAILRAHPLLHTAEGALFREALARACEAAGVPVTGVRARELERAGAGVLGLPPAELKGWLVEAGKALGRPWGRDERDALLVAAVALEAAPAAPPARGPR